jgi:hypothetical protein
MTRRVIVLDTTVLCCLLKVPGKDTAGPADDRWDFGRIDALLKREEAEGTVFVLPLATILETGNHVAQAAGDRYTLAQGLSNIITSAARADTPWAAFTDQADLWGIDRLLALAEAWPSLAAGGTSIGDATIKDVAEWYAQADYNVEIITGDAGLKAYQPLSAPLKPRRRS